MVQPTATEGPTPLGHRRHGQRAWGLMLGGAILALLAAAALLGPWLAPHDPHEQHLALSLEGPRPGFPLGLDELGRDVASRLLHGARVSLGIGLAVVLISSVIGTAWGLPAGYYGGWPDEIGMRLTDVLLAFPGILLALAVMTATGPSPWVLVLALCLTGWVSFARLVRGEALRARGLEHVSAARALGASDLRILLRHVLPECIPPLLVQATLGLGAVIVAEAGLSFLGLGAGGSTPSWGGMLQQGTLHQHLAWHLTVLPGACIALSVLALNLLGDGLGDALDPRRRNTGRRS